MMPAALVVIVCIVGYVILLRFLAYVRSINEVYNDHFSRRWLKGIVAILELKDPHTRGHSERGRPLLGHAGPQGGGSRNKS